MLSVNKLQEMTLHSQIADTDFGGRADTVTRFSGQTHDPRAGIIDVNFGVAGMHSRECNTIPTSKLNQVLNRENGNLRAINNVALGIDEKTRTPSIAGWREKKRIRPVGDKAI